MHHFRYVHDNSNDEDDEHGEIVPIPSMSEPVSCVEKLHLFLSKGENDFFDNIEKMEAFIDNQRSSWMRQSLLTDFIKS